MRIRLSTRKMLVLVALVTPLLLLIRAMKRGRETVMRAECHCYIGTIALHLHNYHEAYASFPPGTIPNPNLPARRRLSWMVDVQPFFAGAPGLKAIGDRTRGWDEPPNWPQTLKFSYMGCKNEAGGTVPGPLTYVGIAGLGPDARASPPVTAAPACSATIA